MQEARRNGRGRGSEEMLFFLSRLWGLFFFRLRDAVDFGVNFYVFVV